MQASGVGFVVAAVLVAGALAQDEAPEPPRDTLVIRGRWKTKPEEPLPILAIVQGDASSVLPQSKWTLTETGFVGTITAPHLGGPGLVHLTSLGGTNVAVYVFRDVLRGELELGEVGRGDDAPVLVSGRVTDAAGRAAHGATVKVQVRTGPRSSLVLDESAETDERGDFTVRADVRGLATAVLQLSGSWKSARPIAFRPGASGLAVVAQRLCGFHGTVVVPDGFHPSEFEVLVIGEPGCFDALEFGPNNMSWRWSSERLRFPAANSFDVRGIPAGVYEVRLKFPESSRYLARLTDVVVDEVTADLPALRVSEPLSRTTLKFVGDALRGVRVMARNRGDRGKFRPIDVTEDGSARVAWTGEAVELVAWSAEGEVVRKAVSDAEAQLEVTKSEPIPVTFRIPPDVARTRNGHRLLISMRWAQSATFTTPPSLSIDGEDPRTNIELLIPVPDQGDPVANVFQEGWYRLGVREDVRAWSMQSIRDARIARGAPATIDLADGGW